jgi:hypothetical protein
MKPSIFVIGPLKDSLITAAGAITISWLPRSRSWFLLAPRHPLRWRASGLCAFAHIDSRNTGGDPIFAIDDH